MIEVIVLFILFALNVLASFYNTVLCIYCSYVDKQPRLDDLLYSTAFVFSLAVIACDVLFCTYILVLK